MSTPVPTLPAQWPDQRGSRSAAGPFPGSATSHYIASLYQPKRLTIVLTCDTSTALTLERELPFYLPVDHKVLVFPDRETLPYDNFSPHQDIISQRLATLYELPRLQGAIVLVPIPTLMHRLPPINYVAGNSLVLSVGDQLDAIALRDNLTKTGYHAVDTVYEHGEFALRGAVMDIFPMGSPLPYRIDLLDDEVDTLRTFDPQSQRTVAKVTSINLLPAREFPLTKAAIGRFQMNWYEQFDGDADACPVFNDISAGRAPGGAEYYLPLFFDQCATLFDYLPDDAAVIAVGDHHSAAERFAREIHHRFDEYGIDPRRPLLPPHQAFVPVEALYQQLKQYAVLELRTGSDAPVHIESPWQVPPQLQQTGGDSPLAGLRQFLSEHRGPVLLCAESDGRREVLLESLSRVELAPVQVDNWQDFIDSGESFAIATAPIDRGLYQGPEHPCLICEPQLFGQRVAQRRRRKNASAHNTEHVFKDINELRPGVPVVHLEHGVGRYLGLQTLSVDQQDAEFITLEYAKGNKLYVPVSSLHLISRYAGADADHAPLHSLGSEQWEKARRKAAQKASDVAAELLEIYARREARQGFAFSLDDNDYERFANTFPFEETPDQAQAIDAVLNDMCSPGVMDRLVCGDVGFGKTEVAMRAAWLASANQKQVAVLVPTTLLAQQHYNSFVDRFANLPVNVEVVSRFRSAKQIAEVNRRLASGEIDILVGTHKLLQPDWAFADLGLLIIDEEHRFGVKQKEAIKAMRAQVDILTLTATPIPRTLNMALGGIRDLSIIATPPARRLSINTFVREHSTALIKEAVLRETLRGGQVYYLHNEVKTINEKARKLRELLPDLSIGIAHGQMRESELERVMSDFYHQRHHILLCTTIIETGIDIPNANTLIMERADRFGLAQLHQLRGRVGRSHHQAYAYLLCPPRSAMTADAVKRLEAIEAAGDLGAGYMLATHDLEIRGAGELLGDEQSGQIHSVGFGLYMDLLERAVGALKRGDIPAIDVSTEDKTEVNLHLPALIPEDYLPDINTRLVLYKRISAAADDNALRDIQVEMIDRFGLLGDSIKTLFSSARLRLAAKALGIEKVDVSDSGGSFEFSENTRVNPMSLVNRIQGDPRTFQLAGATRLRFSLPLHDAETRIGFISDLLEQFSKEAA